MRDSKTYIETGVLELFVCGILSENEMVEVARNVLEDEKLLEEVVAIEGGLMHLARAAAPHKPTYDKVEALLKKKHKDGKGDRSVIPLSRKRTTGIQYLGWAAAILLLFGTGYLYLENEKLEDRFVETERELLLQEGKTQIAEEDLQNTEYFLNAVRSQNVISVPLEGQEIAPEAYASVFWDTKNNIAIVDVRGLPKPPEGKVYQVWSLTLKPLTPTSLGVIDAYDPTGNQIFELNNPNASQAFGITLEPAGGSNSPTLEQLYTLGMVTS